MIESKRFGMSSITLESFPLDLIVASPTPGKLKSPIRKDGAIEDCTLCETARSICFFMFKDQSGTRWSVAMHRFPSSVLMYRRADLPGVMTSR